VVRISACLRPDCSSPSCDYADRTEIVRAVGLLRRRGVVAVRAIELSSVAAAPADDRRTWGRGMARACALCELCAHKKTPVSLGDCRGAVVDRGWWIVRSSIPFAELRLKADECSGVDDASVVSETK